MSSEATDNTMRAEFEARIPSFWSRARAVDSDGDSLYTDDWVQGAWIGYRLARADTARQVAEGYTSGTATSDFHGAKITLRYVTTEQAERAFVAITDQIDAAIRARSTPATGEKP